MRWGLEKAAALGVEMWLDAFPPARDFYQQYGFVAVQENDIRPCTDTPDEEWLRAEKELLPLATRVMWRPRDGPFVQGRSAKPWEQVEKQ